MLSVRNHIKNLTLLLITKLGQYFKIFGRFWINKHRVLLNIIHDSILFSSGFYMHLETFLFFISSKLIKETNKILKAKQQQDIIPTAF